MPQPPPSKSYQLWHLFSPSLKTSHSAAVARITMAKAHSESSDDFEFIETPAAPTPQPPAENCGVRTTSVSELQSGGE
jgi:hypothetical protein